MAQRLRISRYHDGCEIIGNRDGLQDLSEVCLAPSRLSDGEAKTAANHYHFAEYMNDAEEGSLPFDDSLSARFITAFPKKPKRTQLTTTEQRKLPPRPPRLSGVGT
jgi:hypothetical protein